MGDRIKRKTRNRVDGFLGYLLFHKDGQDGFSNPPASSAPSSARLSVYCSFLGFQEKTDSVLLVWVQIGKRRSVRR
jgi:hypothetical protein